MDELRLTRFTDYQAYLLDHPSEWPILDSLCWIAISRFYRDRALFQSLEVAILPALAERAAAHGQHKLTCWSLGCASGEEPYSLAILWNLAVAPRLPEGMTLDVLATDIDPQAIERGKQGCYGPSSVKDLLAPWREQAFVPTASGLCLKPEHKKLVTFQEQDVRRGMPEGPFDLILCRYLIFTYFDVALQQRLLAQIMDRLHGGGALVIGTTDVLPTPFAQLEPWPGCKLVYRKRDRLTGREC